MTGPAAHRTLAGLVDDEAPLPGPRACSIMVAVARDAERIERSGRHLGPISADEVELRADGTAVIRGAHSHQQRQTGDPGHEGDRPSPAAASIGQLLFLLISGRLPLGTEDAFEPAARDAFSAEVCSLLARSISQAPGQWPGVGEWRRTLEEEAGALAPPLPRRVLLGRTARRVLLGVGVALLTGATIAALLLAPGWWDSLEEGSTSPSTPVRNAQGLRDSS
jgi:hypothetical protein